MHGSGSGGAGAAPLTRISCDADELRDGWAAWTSAPGSAARKRESRDSEIDSEELPPGPHVPGVIDMEYLSLRTSINLPLTDSDDALISTGAGKLN